MHDCIGFSQIQLLYIYSLIPYGDVATLYSPFQIIAQILVAYWLSVCVLGLYKQVALHALSNKLP